MTRKGNTIHQQIKCMEVTNLLEFSERGALRAWLEANHDKERACWVAVYRTKIPKENCLPYIEVVEEALCFGWIDSTVKRLEDGRMAQRLSPRAKKSHWTARNIQRCAELEKQGLMTPAGRRAIPPSD